MLGQDVVPARYLRDDHARCKRFGHDPSLDLIAPPPATTRTDLDVDPTPWLRTVDYMLNHICEPICVRCVACCRSARGRQGGGRRPLTTEEQARIGRRPAPAVSTAVPIRSIPGQDLQAIRSVRPDDED